MHRKMLAVLASLMLATAVEAAEPRRVRVIQAPAGYAFLPVDYAIAAGYFAAEGLQVERLTPSDGADDLRALANGDAEFGVADGPAQIDALADGRAIVNVYNLYNRALIGLVIGVGAAKRSGIGAGAPLLARLQALKGLRIGIERSGSLADKQVRHLLRIGAVEGEVAVRALGDRHELLTAFKRGDIDGFAAAIPLDRIAVARGEAVMWVDMAAGSAPSIDPLIMESLVTTLAFADGNPEVIGAMKRALRRSVNDIVARPAEEIRDVVQATYAKVSPAVVLGAIRAARRALNLTGDVSLQMARNTLLLDGRSTVTAEALYTAYRAR